jgi:hypothetical protein
MQQEIRYFAGSYDEPSGVLTFNDLSIDEQALYNKGAILEMYEPNEPSRHYIDPLGISSVVHKTKHGFKVQKNSPLNQFSFLYSVRRMPPPHDQKD